MDLKNSPASQNGWYYGWSIVAVCVIAGIAASALPINAYSLFLNSWSTDLRVPVSSVQYGIASVGLGSSLLAPFAGILADKYPARLLMGIGVLGTTILCLAISFMTEFWEYLALYACLVPFSLLFSTSLIANAVVSRWFVKRLGLAVAITALGLGMAGVVMPPIVAATMPVYGWRWIWRIGGIITGVIVLPLVVLILRDRPSEKDGTYYLTGNTNAVSLHGSSHASQGAVPLRWKDALMRRNFWLLLIVYLPMLGLYGGCGQNVGPIAASRGFSTHAAGVMLSAFSVSQLIATLAAGVLSDRFGNRAPLAGFAFAAASGGLLVALSHGMMPLGIGIFLTAIGGSFWPLLAAAIAREFGANAVGRVFGLLSFFVPLTGLAPFAVAKSQEMAGSCTPAVLVLSAITAIGGLVCLIWMRERKPDVLAQAPSSIAAV